MKPSRRVLDENLSALLTRAYSPAKPRAEFVARLERELRPWISAAGPQPLRSRREARPRRTWVLGVLAAAAALLLLLRWMGEPSGPSREESQVAGLEQLTSRGEVALRFDAVQAWRAATEQERVQGVTHSDDYLAVATPDGLSVDVHGSSGWSATLFGASLLVVEPAERGLRLNLFTGSAQLSTKDVQRDVSAPFVVHWRDGDFYGADGSPWGPAVAALPTETKTEREVVPADAEPETTDATPSTSETATLTGRVVASGSEAPFPSFSVSVLLHKPLPQVSFPETRAFEDPTGEFVWEDLVPGNYDVFVHVEGLAVWKSGRIDVKASSLHHVEAELAEGFAIRGFVIDEKSGNPVAGALVVDETDMPSRVIGLDAAELPPISTAHTRTRHDGSFVLENMTSGDHILRASGEEHAPSWTEITLSGSDGDGVLLELVAGGAVEGRCEHPDGTPFTGARVVVSRFSTGRSGNAMTYRGAFTDEKGEYRVDHMAAGMYVVLLFGEDPGAQPFQPRYSPVGIREGVTSRVDFLGEHRKATIAGRVVYGDGRPVPFANLHAWSFNDGDPNWSGETADAEGRFEILGLEPGDYGLYAGSASSTVLAARVDVQAGERVERELVLEGESLDIEVYDARTRERLAYLDLSLVKQSADPGGTDPMEMVVARVFTEGDGDLQLQYLEPGMYDLLAIPEDGQHAFGVHRGIWIEEGVKLDPIVMNLELACPVVLTLEDEEGRALEGVQVDLVSPNGEEWDYPWTPLSDGGGRMALNRLSPGKWTLILRHEDYFEERIEVVAVRGPPQTRRVKMRSR